MRSKLLILATTGALLFAGCNERREPLRVQAFSLRDHFTVQVGEVKEMPMVIYPAEAAVLKMDYRIDYENMIRFDPPTRKVTGLAEGMTWIRIGIGGLVDSCRVHVLPGPQQSGLRLSGVEGAGDREGGR